MTTDREILKRLFKIAKNQQKILNKLAAYPALEKFISDFTYAWLVNTMGQGKIPSMQESGYKFVKVDVNQEESGRFDVVIQITPSIDWTNEDLQKLDQLVKANGPFEQFMYDRLQVVKGLSPQNVRLRPFVRTPSPVQEIVDLEGQGNKPVAQTGYKTPSYQGGVDRQDPTQMRKERMR